MASCLPDAAVVAAFSRGDLLSPSIHYQLGDALSARVASAEVGSHSTVTRIFFKDATTAVSTVHGPATFMAQASAGGIPTAVAPSKPAPQAPSAVAAAQGASPSERAPAGAQLAQVPGANLNGTVNPHGTQTPAPASSARTRGRVLHASNGNAPGRKARSPSYYRGQQARRERWLAAQEGTAAGHCEGEHAAEHMSSSISLLLRQPLTAMPALSQHMRRPPWRRLSRLMPYQSSSGRVAPWQQRHCTTALAHTPAGRHHRPSSRALQERCRTLVPRSPSAAVSLRTPMPTGNRPTSRTSTLLAA